MQERREEAEARYIGGEMTLRALAAEMGLSLSTVARWSKEGEWQKKRRELTARALEKAMKRRERQEAKEFDKLLTASDQLEEALTRAAAQFAQALEEAEDKRGRGKTADGFRMRNLQSLAAAIGSALDTRERLKALLEADEGQGPSLRVEMDDSIKEMSQ